MPIAVPSKAIKHVQRPGLDNIYSLNSVLSSERLVLGNITLHSESRSIDPAVEKKLVQTEQHSKWKK